MQVFELPEIRHDLSGFQALARLCAATDGFCFEEIRIDMRSAVWFDADMCAPFGAVLYRLSERVNSVRLSHIPPAVAGILSKNGFLSNYGFSRIPDAWGTTVPYRRFVPKEDRLFVSYIEEEFMRRPEIPRMTPGLGRRFRESVLEVFGNSTLHSRTRLGIFGCGQFFPKRAALNVAVADLGIGIRNNVKDTLGIELSGEDAIDWATKAANTTKRGHIPGGLGLKLLCEFIRLNKGELQIVSDTGYWRLDQHGVYKSPLAHPFPGTVTVIEINTSDSRSYVSAGDLRAEYVF